MNGWGDSTVFFEKHTHFSSTYAEMKHFKNHSQKKLSNFKMREYLTLFLPHSARLRAIFHHFMGISLLLFAFKWFNWKHAYELSSIHIEGMETGFDSFCWQELRFDLSIYWILLWTINRFFNELKWMDSHKMRRIRIRVCVSWFPFGMWISLKF